ncbi:hypothetical protein EIK77_000390 [Talaromyces pinophilus]|jgi:hypothetical protein|nr:hypothetical protein EIK77_000390 [Talaromyces pinophilus]
MGPIVGGIIGSYIAAAYGWRWTQWLNVILSGATLLSCTLFLPETFFDRDAAIALDLAAEGIIQQEKEKATVTEKQNIAEYERVSRVVAASHPYQPYTFARSLRVGLYSGNFVQNFLAPWKTLRLPAVWLVMLHYGGLVGGIVTISTVGPQFVAAPPYNWGANAGLINIGGLIGSIAGALATFFISDRILKRHAFRHSHGFSEPESRLPALFPGLFLATMGLLTFGMCEQYVTSGAGWVGLEVGYGMLVFGVMQVPSIGFNYVSNSISHHPHNPSVANFQNSQIIESYPLAAHDCFVMITCLRAIIGFAWTFFVGTWVERRGAAEPFGIFCMLMGIFGLLTIPIYFYGKRIRIATEKWFPSTME